ncbi:hypothetical protein Areg01_62380 [Actinoplanes regularis]|nr:hypothetical protein Areg01_62380 [Actinoplanes regularis]
MFSLFEINDWLERQRKHNDVSDEVLVWQALRARVGDDMVTGIAEVAELFTSGDTGSLDEATRLRLTSMAAESSPVEVVAALVERLIDSGATFTGSRLATVVAQLAGPHHNVIFDPACGAASLLLAVALDGKARLYGQDVNDAAARLARARAVLSDHDLTVVVGDSLRADHQPGLRADLVVCDPPAGSTDWGRDGLLLDQRWEFGVPTKAEGELAWLQHCYSHLAPGGMAILVMSPSVAYRRPGRRIRAELVRRGIITQVTALPPGMVAAHSQSVHLWSVVRPGESGPVTSVRFHDLSADDPAGALAPEPHQVAQVPLVDLLDEDVDLTPARHVEASHTDRVARYTAARNGVLDQLGQVTGGFPKLAAGSGVLDGTVLRVSDLARAGLIKIHDGTVTSTSDQLDTDFLRGFLRSSANTSRATSGSGTFRADVRGARIPQLSIDEQRSYAAAFRALDEAEQRLRDIARFGQDAVARARDGLTSGALRPDE